MKIVIMKFISHAPMFSNVTYFCVVIRIVIIMLLCHIPGLGVGFAVGVLEGVADVENTMSGDVGGTWGFFDRGSNVVPYKIKHQL